MGEGSGVARSRIIVSYESAADASAADRLIHSLRQRVTAEEIVALQDLVPTNGNQPPADVESVLESCLALLVIIGADRSNGVRRDVPVGDSTLTHDTFTSALAAGHILILVLLDGAQMPEARDLPEGMERLSTVRAVRVTDASWGSDVDALLEVIHGQMELGLTVRRARAALDDGDYESALQMSDSVLALEPGRADATEIRAQAAKAAEAALQWAGQGRPRPLFDENVQFTVFRRSTIQPDRWYPLLVFAHLSERRADAPDEPDPIVEVQTQASQALGDALADFRTSTEDSGQPVMRDGELRVVPRMDGVTFNPPERRFLWTESVHREDFRMRADASMQGRTARGTVTVYAGNVLLADVQVSVKVDRHAVSSSQEQASARAYRRIFASYSHRDTPVVEEFESHAAATGDRYLRDVVTLRAGEVWNARLRELIGQADVFQLFWSWNALASPLVREEWRHALSLNRPNFVRPVYWEEPFPEQAGLPPAQLRRLHFQRVYPRVAAVAATPGAADMLTRTGVHRIPAQIPVTEASRSAPPSSPPSAPPGSPGKPERSPMRFVRYGSVAAACVLAAGLFLVVQERGRVERVEVPPPPPTTGVEPPPPTGQPPKAGGRAGDSVGRGTADPVKKPGGLGGLGQVKSGRRGEGTASGSSGFGTLEQSAVSAIREYEAAWARHDRAALERVWLMSPEQAREVDKTMRDSDSIRVDVRILDAWRVNDTSAVVRVEETRTEHRHGGPRRSVGIKVFDLEKRGGRWLIVTSTG